ncbi:hypothetical protein CKAN_01389800 [Cinnamomum micranthum f. kanehirae]|uniref:Uncharacterized protein n=1 Tax=Cinnamomum micranthum f. kanehirae TaxID=337451 RepID=A0A443P2X5_9MAGN|nr:hypothetical protein CKAN_01389800 [Cinnamomum micranthum f. kanehirae]
MVEREPLIPWFDQLICGLQHLPSPSHPSTKATLAAVTNTVERESLIPWFDQAQSWLPFLVEDFDILADFDVPLLAELLQF